GDPEVVHGRFDDLHCVVLYPRGSARTAARLGAPSSPTDPRALGGVVDFLRNDRRVSPGAHTASLVGLVVHRMACDTSLVSSVPLYQLGVAQSPRGGPAWRQ